MKTASTKTKSIAQEAPAALTSPSTRTSVLILIVITLALLVPFAGKAFHMDDPLFIWSARYIQSHPADPYGFSVNWYGKLDPMWRVTKNPPLTCYYMALAAFVVGWSEWALHLAFLIPALAAVLGTYFLARMFCSRPLEAALAAILTPAFLVSGTTVMCDIMMLAFWVWAIYLWVRGMETNRGGLLASAMALVTLSALTKYFGIALIPLLAAYSLIKARRLGSWVAYLFIPAAVLAAYQIGTHSLYGRGLLSDAGHYATWYRGWAAETTAKPVIGLAFTGGCILTAVFCAPLLWSRKGLSVGLVLIGLGFLLFSLRPIDGLGPGKAAAMQFALLSVGGISLLALALADYLSRRDAGSLMLLLWIVGTFVFASVLNWSVNARSILPMAPAAGILIVRRLESRRLRRGLFAYVYLPLVLAACASTLIAYADYHLAGTAREAADQIALSYSSEDRDIWFEGHWGFQYYMQLNGGKPVEFQKSNPRAGDIVVIPANNTNIQTQSPGFPPTEVLSYESPLKLATMVKPVGAGFFTDAWGPLPFAIGSIPPEYYGIYEVP